MNSVFNLKNAARACTAAVAAAAAELMGGWDASLTTLLLFMAVDYISGLIVAAVFKNSDKSESGALESRAGFKGLCKKGLTLALVLAAARLDVLFCGGAVYRTAVIMFFISNEGISILENLGLMGVKYPQALRNALEVLTSKNN